METVSVQFINEEQPFLVITHCDEKDTCPGCGAGYKVGMSQCEYCSRPVQVSMAEVVAPVVAFMTGQAS